MNLETLDLHRIKHADVEERVCKFLNWTEPPCRIITGKSSEMRTIVEKIVDRYGYACYTESALNYGSLLIVEPFIKDFE